MKSIITNSMFYKAQIIFTVCLLLNIMSLKVVAQTGSSDPVSYTIEAPETVKAGDKFTISVVFNIKPGWFLYAPIEKNTVLGKIPTEVTFKVPEDIKKLGEMELLDETLFFDTYRGDGISMFQKFQVDKSVFSGKYIIKANVVYQTCNEDICYPPVRKKIDLVIVVVN
ncbi:protein-disulfide reductase DsbD domain-containing protein [Flavivirga sp. 57AJ16]|uniref:protein-disulfide reductase DsbD domain-containing protein n=1 Tax=Flavivirga sp. 57AJ16 TaxID=3025307 RepID=UPI0023667477|nr:protein-disulfide reductase DsbD domain-containing protein [Flavivirga sp. 57AJ16]MDD7885411.1 protein-disulfide reductase DsbD family protein [Flavivirga sp. 57AJ16]